MNALAIYIHWPFCLSKCPYCDFNSRPVPSALDEERWVRAYQRELQSSAARLPERQISSIYFGGGTPSLMRPQTVEALLTEIARYWPLADHCEITLEANPAASAEDRYRELHQVGINRLSLGVQALEDGALRFLGRAHDVATARRAMQAAAKVFDRFSYDLIYARQNQTAEGWAAELQEALSFGPKHLSLYQLTIEPRTVFYKRAQREALTADEDLALQLLEQTQSQMAKAGLSAYEISNYARPGEESRHNLTYWKYGDYIGIGPGAHGRFVAGAERWATENVANPDRWMEGVEERGFARANEESLSSDEAQREALLMGLRLVSGLDKTLWVQKFGQSIGSWLDKEKLKTLVEQGLMVDAETRLYPTALGQQKLNAILSYLL